MTFDLKEARSLNFAKNILLNVLANRSNFAAFTGFPETQVELDSCKFNYDESDEGVDISFTKGLKTYKYYVSCRLHRLLYKNTTNDGYTLLAERLWQSIEKKSVVKIHTFYKKETFGWVDYVQLY